MAQARKVHEAWEGSGLLIHGGRGHGVETQPSRCMDQVIRAYLVNGTLPKEGTKCDSDTSAFEWAYELAKQSWRLTVTTVVQEPDTGAVVQQCNLYFFGQVLIAFTDFFSN